MFTKLNKLSFYDVDVIACAQMPRSRAEKAQIYMQLAQMGKIPETKTGTDLLLTHLGKFFNP